jgi:hypothetical protein
MARVFTVGPNSTYAGILSALSSVSALYTNPDTDGQDWVFECEAFTDITSGNAGIAPTTAGTNNYSIIIRPQVGAHHEGVSGGGYTLYSPFNSYVSLYINAPNTVLEGVQFNVGPAKFLRLRGAGCVFKQCIFNGSSANEIFNEAADNVSFLNCLFKSSVDDVKSSAVFKNCVFDVGTSYAILPNSSQTPLVQNCVFLGHVTGAVDGSVSAGSSNNCSHDSSIGSAVSSTDGVDFVSPSTGDYTPTATGALFKAGTNPLSPLSHPDDWKDITGKTRAYWDIGAFAAPASLAENTHLATFTTRPTDTGASGGPNVAGTETNYPGYIDLSEAPQALWDAVTSGGGDIRVFENQAGGLVELPAEVVSCDTSAETGELHYLLPSISASTPQEIRLYADGVSSRYDHADPFGRNAVWGDYSRVFHLGDVSGGFVDSTGNADGSLSGTATRGASVGNFSGVEFGASGHSSAVTADTLGISDTSNFYVSVWTKITASQSAWAILYADGDAAGYEFQAGRYNATGDINAKFGSEYARTISGGWSALADGEAHYFGTRFLYSNFQAIVSYVDTTRISGSSLSLFEDQPSSPALNIGNNALVSNGVSGAFAEFRVRDNIAGVIGDANWITTEYNNQSDPTSFYTATDPNAGGGESISPDSLYQSVSIEGVTLTQAHVLAAANLAQLQAIGAATLAQANSIAPHGVDQTAGIESATLTQAHIIAPAGISQHQQIGTASLVSAGVLSVFGLAQTQTLDEAILTVAGALDVDGVSQSQVLEALTLVQNNILAPAGLAQEAALEATTINAAALGITPAGIEQVMAIDPTGLTQYHVLAVSDLAQDQILEAARFGGLVIGELQGRIYVFAALDGDVYAIPALTGTIH